MLTILLLYSEKISQLSGKMKNSIPYHIYYRVISPKPSKCADDERRRLRKSPDSHFLRQRDPIIEGDKPRAVSPKVAVIINNESVRIMIIL